MSEPQPPQAAEPEEHHDQRVFTREFKLEAVRLSESSEKTVAQIARDLGDPRTGALSLAPRNCGSSTTRRFPGKGHQSELEEENRRLRRELDLLGAGA